MKNILTAIIATLVISFFTTSVQAEEETIPKIYVRQGCQYCAKVDAFLRANDLEDKVERVETLNNAENQKELEELFNKYNAPEADRGVPFMVLSETEYLVGDRPIIKHLSEKYDIEVVEEEYSTSTSDIVFMILGGTFMLSILGYGLYSAFKKK